MNSKDNEVNKEGGELPDKGDGQLKDKNQEEVTKVTSVLEFLKWVEGLGGTEILFRGQNCCKHEVKSGAKRLFGNDISYSSSEISHNFNIIENAKMQGIYDNSNSATAKTDWGILAQQQHIGAATSLLDFSSNPLVSLFFACQICSKKCKCNQQGGEVYSIAVDHPVDFDEFDSLDKLKKYKVEDVINDYRSIYWKPAHINNRIIAQNSYFIIGGQFNNLKKCFIPEENKEDILVDLYRLYDINRITLFPDEVGLAEANSTNPKYTIVYLEYLNAGLKFHRRGQYEQAIEKYTQIIKNAEYKDHYKSQAYNNRGFARASWGSEIIKSGEIQGTINQYNAAIKDFNEAVKINKTIQLTTSIDDMHRITNDLSRNYYNLGLTNMQLSTYYIKWGNDKEHKYLLEKAITHIDNSLFNNKKYAEAYSARGSAQAELGNYKQAFDDIRAAIDINPYLFKSYLARASIRFIQIRAYKLKNKYDDNKEQLQKISRDAISDCDRVIMLYHNCYEAYIYRGIFNAVIEESKEIIQNDFNTAFKIMPGAVDTNLIYGFALSLLADNSGYELVDNDRNKCEELMEIYRECLSNLEIFGKEYPKNKDVNKFISEVKNRITELEKIMKRYENK